MSLNNTFFLAFFLLIFSVKFLNADLPPDMQAYLTEKIPFIIEFLPVQFSKSQTDITLHRLQDLLIQKFHKSIAHDPSFKASELYAYLQKSFTDKVVESAVKIDPEAAKLLEGQSEGRLDKKKISLLINSYSGQKKDNFINLKYHNLILPLALTKYPGNLFAIRLLGLPLVSRKEADFSAICLDLEINPIKNSAHIEWLNSAYTACPIAGEHQGKLLLALAEDIATAMQLEKISLLDNSKVLCQENNTKVNLKILKIFQTGRSWYESNGYMPDTEEKRKKYRSQVDKFINYKISDLTRELDQVEQSKIAKAILKANSLSELEYINNFIENRIFFHQKLSKFRAAYNDDLFSKFMSWLYNDSCADYQKIYDFIFPSEKYHPSFTITSLLPENISLMKMLKVIGK
jgi:hypothetical protein